MYEIIAIVSNLGALSAIGFIYVAYIKNLNSISQLKDSQLKVAEQNIKLWKDKALELERKSPEFIEIQLSERIKIREEEISRLAQDSETHEEKIEKKNKEIIAIKESLDKTYEYRKSFSVWDRDASDFIEVPHSELEQNAIGSVCVDTASLMICDPFYPISPPHFDEDFKVQKNMYQVIESGEYFCTDHDDVSYNMELLGLDEDLSLDQMIEKGILKKVEYSGDIPAIKSSYIKGELQDREYKKYRHLSFLNGQLGAGIAVSLNGDGVYPVSVETYKGELQRIIIDV